MSLYQSDTSFSEMAARANVATSSRLQATSLVASLLRASKVEARAPRELTQLCLCLNPLATVG